MSALRRFYRTTAVAVAFGCGLCTPAVADDTPAFGLGGTADVPRDAPPAPSSDPPPAPAPPVHVPAIALESALVLLFPTAYYWNTTEHQSVDWTLDWDWPSWKAKLFSTDKLKFDTNPFHINAIRHPLVGAIDYHVGRTNGLSMMGSTLLAFLSGVFWEYFIEFREAPSINDMILNGAAGLSIGEPFYQVGQSWRGGSMSVTDRLQATLFSPIDTLHDVFRDRRGTRRALAWRSIELGGGADVRWHGGSSTHELALVGDVDVVNHEAFMRPGAHAGAIRPGAWSRIRASIRLGEGDGQSPQTQTVLQTRTSIVGRYWQSAGGVGSLVALGSAFSYRYDRLGLDRDRLAFAHLVGPQLQLSIRTGATAVRLDLAGYGDFALVQALALGPVNPFPRPPPFYTSVQAGGYYYGLGLSAIARLRAERDAWQLDAEVEAHRTIQIEDHTFHDTPVEASTVSATGLADTRVFARVKLGFRPSWWGVTATLDDSYRLSEWGDVERRLPSTSFGLGFEVNY